MWRGAVSYKSPVTPRVPSALARICFLDPEVRKANPIARRSTSKVGGVIRRASEMDRRTMTQLEGLGSYYISKCVGRPHVAQYVGEMFGPFGGKSGGGC
jgi:hypothetical protein